MLRPLSLFAGWLAVQLVSGCSQPECARLSDCEPGFVCVAGTCERGGGGIGRPTPGDLGVRADADGGADAEDGVDADGGADAMDSPDVSTADADAGASDADGGGVGLALPARAHIQVFEGSRIFTNDFTIRGFLQDRSVARFDVVEERFSGPGIACTLTEETLRSGSVRAFSTGGVEVVVENGDPIHRLMTSPEGRLSRTIERPPGEVTQTGFPSTFRIAAAPPTAPQPRLGAIEAEVPMPPFVTGLTGYPPRTPVELRGLVQLQWLPVGTQFGQIRLEVLAGDEQDLRLECVVDDLGQVSLPRAAADAFLARRGDREARFRFVVREARTVEVPSDSGTQPVQLWVDVGIEAPVR